MSVLFCGQIGLANLTKKGGKIVREVEYCHCFLGLIRMQKSIAKLWHERCNYYLRRREMILKSNAIFDG